MKYKIADIRVEGDQARIVLEEVVEEEGMGDGFAKVIPLAQLETMGLRKLKALIKEWIKERREILKRAQEERAREEAAAKDFEKLKGAEIGAV